MKAYNIQTGKWWVRGGPDDRGAFTAVTRRAGTAFLPARWHKIQAYWPITARPHHPGDPLPEICQTLRVGRTLSEVETLRNELAEERRAGVRAGLRLRELQERDAQRCAEIDELKRRIVPSTSAAVVDNLRAELDTAIRTVTGLQAKFDQKWDEANALRVREARLERALADLRKSNEAQFDTITRLQSSAAKGLQDAANLEHVSKQLSDCIHERNDLQAALNSCREQTEKVSADRRALYQQLEEENTRLRDEAQDWRRKYRGALTQVIGLMLDRIRTRCTTIIKP